MTLTFMMEMTTAVYLLLLALSMSTKNWESTLVFKIIPLFCGLGLLVVAAIEYGLIVAPA